MLAGFDIIEDLLQPFPASSYGISSITEETFATATLNGDERIFSLLSQRRPDVFDNVVHTPWLLFEAAALGARIPGTGISKFEELRAKGFDVQATDTMGRGSPLAFATNHGNFPLMVYLLEAGVNVDSLAFGSFHTISKLRPYHKTKLFTDYLEESREAKEGNQYAQVVAAIHVAIFKGDVEIVRFLLDNGSDPNLPGVMYPIQVAAACGNLEITELLLERGAHPDYINPVTYSGHFYDHDIVNVLDYTYECPDTSALQLSLRGGHLDLFEALLRQNASFAKPPQCNCYNSFNGYQVVNKNEKNIVTIDQTAGNDGFSNYAFFGAEGHGVGFGSADEIPNLTFSDHDSLCVTVQKENFWNPLLDAAQEGNEEIFLRLSTINYLNRHGWITPGVVARCTEQFGWTFVAEHIKKGIFPSQSLYTAEVLLDCISNRDDEFAKHLITSGILHHKDNLAAFALSTVLMKVDMLDTFLTQGFWPDEFCNIPEGTLKPLCEDEGYDSYRNSRNEDYVLTRDSLPENKVSIMKHYSELTFQPLVEAYLLDIEEIIRLMLNHYSKNLETRQMPGVKQHFSRALGIAIQFGDLDAMKMLLSQLEIDEVDYSTEIEGYSRQVEAVFCTTVQVATAFKQNVIAEWLLDHGGNPNSTTFTPEGKMSYHSPLQCAVRDGSVQLVKKLLEAGAEVNAEPMQINGATALQFAAMLGHFEMLRILLEANADINAPPGLYGGRSAIEGAAEWGRLDLVRYLLDIGADVRGKENSNYRRAVYRAYMHGHRILVSMIQE